MRRLRRPRRAFGATLSSDDAASRYHLSARRRGRGQFARNLAACRAGPAGEQETHLGTYPEAPSSLTEQNRETFEAERLQVR